MWMELSRATGGFQMKASPLDRRALFGECWFSTVPALSAALPLGIGAIRRPSKRSRSRRDLRLPARTERPECQQASIGSCGIIRSSIHSAACRADSDHRNQRAASPLRLGSGWLRRRSLPSAYERRRYATLRSLASRPSPNLTLSTSTSASAGMAPASGLTRTAPSNRGPRIVAAAPYE